MTNYVTPKTSIEILDGQLLTSVSIPADATLVMDVAEKGPTDRLYFVTDAKEASSVYGTNSPIVQAMQKTFRTGTKNVLLYRVGGTSPTLENIFGEDTSITVRTASTSADINLRVYIGPEPLNPSLDCVIIFNKDRIVYSNTMADPVDLNVVEVEGFDKVDNEVYVGSISNPVPFSLVDKELGERISATSATATIDLGTSYKEENVSQYSKVVTANGVRLRSTQYAFSTSPTNETTLTVTDPDIASASPLEVVYTYVKKLAPVYIETTESVTTPNPAKLSITSAYDINDVKHTAWTEITGQGKVFLTPSDYTISSVSSTYTVTLLKEPSTTPGVSYTFGFSHLDLDDETSAFINEFTYLTGEDLINASYKKLYEAFDTAFTNLELIPLKNVILPDLQNVPNVAYKDTDSNVLEYLNISIDENDDKVYEWSKTKFLYKKGSGTTVEISEADLTSNGQPIVSKQYGQVDFAHRAGMWALEKNAEGIYPNIIMGVIGPSRFDTKSINRWVGKEPVRDTEMNIVENGTGLLGHPLMVGSTTFQGGYFATDNGFVDGNLVPDSNGFIIDLGKYLSFVVSQTLPSSSSINSYARSGAAEYSGIVDNITQGNGATNQVIPNSYLLTPIKASKVAALSKAGYVVFKNDLNRGVVVVSGDLATRENSDYDFIGTAIVVSSIVTDLHEVGSPYIGRGIDGLTLVTLQTALTTRMTERQKQGWFINFQLQVYQSAPNVVVVAYTITAKDELREIAATLKLNRQIFTDINGEG